jgi:TRAP-type uncharacterized transport system substrate-binding protein
MLSRIKLDRHFAQSRIGIVVIIITVVVSLIVTAIALRPLPSRELTLATGAPGSSYAKAGEQYREILARDGVRLRLMQTRGAVDNARLLGDPHSGVQAAFVQAGTFGDNPPPDLESIGTVFYQATWLFCRCESVRSLTNTPGWRLSIGPVGSASRPLAEELLRLNGIDDTKLKIFGYLPEESEKALMNGALDGLMLVSGWDSPVVQRLTRAPGITLLGFVRADAYLALDPTLSKLTLPRGVADLAADRPSADITLIASKASLAVRKDLHPALQYLLLQAAIEIHSRAGIFQRAGEFPAPEEIDLPLSDEARHIYRAGPSFLQRSLPFWLAQMVQRLLILLLPVAGIIYPLWSLAPKLYAWQMRRRINRMYSELKLVERDLRVATAATRSEMLSRLEEIDARTLELKVPVSFAESTFNLRAHIRAMRARARGIR